MDDTPTPTATSELYAGVERDFLGEHYWLANPDTHCRAHWWPLVWANPDGMTDAFLWAAGWWNAMVALEHGTDRCGCAIQSATERGRADKDAKLRALVSGACADVYTMEDALVMWGKLVLGVPVDERLLPRPLKGFDAAALAREGEVGPGLIRRATSKLGSRRRRRTTVTRPQTGSMSMPPAAGTISEVPVTGRAGARHNTISEVVPMQAQAQAQ